MAHDDRYRTLERSESSDRYVEGLDNRAAFDADEVQGVLTGRFYSARDERPNERDSERNVAKPTHYKVICISMYTKDLEKLDQLVGELKARGLTKANRSALIRAALDQVDLDRVPRGI